MKLALALALLSAPPAAAQSLSILVTEGDSIPGVGLVTRIDGVEISSTGGAFIEVDTDNTDTDADSVMLRDSAVFLREGQPLTVPGGATLGSFDGVSINSSDVPMFNLFLDGTGASTNNSGVFFGDQLLIQEGDACNAVGLAPGTVYTGFFDVQWASDTDCLVMASVDDPTIPSTTDRALIVLTVDAAGNLIGEGAVAAEGFILQGQTEPVADLETGAEEYAMNGLGLPMFTVDLAGDTSVDRAVYVGTAPVMQEGSPSPIAGRNWGSLTSVELDINDFGSWIAKANLDSSDTTTDQVLVLDGAIYQQEGGTLPDIAPFTFQDFGGGNGVFIQPSGDVLWFGDWDDPDTSRDEGLFLNDRLILQEGVTVVDGHTIVDLADFTESLYFSEDGFQAVIEGQINPSGTNLDVAILVEFLDGPQSYCQSNPNATGFAAQTTLSGDPSVSGSGLVLGMDQLPPQAFAFFITSETQGFVANPGGSVGNLCLGGEIGRFIGPGQVLQAGAAGSVSLTIDVTQLPQPTGFVSAQAGDEWNFQGWFRDFNSTGPTSNFSSGVSVIFEP